MADSVLAFVLPITCVRDEKNVAIIQLYQESQTLIGQFVITPRGDLWKPEYHTNRGNRYRLDSTLLDGGNKGSIYFTET